MASLNMKGPFDLESEVIDEKVTKKSKGNYALGQTNSEGAFEVAYVGRSDSDLNERLKQHLGEGFREFKFSIANSVKEAFDKECKNYHDFGENKKLKNDIHPRRPDGCSYACPYCDELV